MKFQRVSEKEFSKKIKKNLFEDAARLLHSHAEQMARANKYYRCAIIVCGSVFAIFAALLTYYRLPRLMGEVAQSTDGEVSFWSAHLAQKMNSVMPFFPWLLVSTAILVLLNIFYAQLAKGSVSSPYEELPKDPDLQYEELKKRAQAIHVMEHKPNLYMSIFGAFYALFLVSMIVAESFFTNLSAADYWSCVGPMAWHFLWILPLEYCVFRFYLSILHDSILYDWNLHAFKGKDAEIKRNAERKDGERIYQEAISKDPVDIGRIEVAANMGCFDAIVYMGEHWNQLLLSRKKIAWDYFDKAEKLMRYLIKATRKHIEPVEAQEFLGDYAHYHDWNAMYDTFDKILATQKLSGDMKTMCEDFQHTVGILRDDALEKWDVRSSVRSPSSYIERPPCIWSCGSLCNYWSDEKALMSCRYPGNQTDCPVASFPEKK